ncbi:MAG: DUF11 domain-containing protein, partial [bacterium]|nr:DUF11 domain-containing protein [bacterium]
MAKADSLIPVERIASQIYLLRGEKVMLDSDLAALYGIETGALTRAMKRNQERFPDDFCFQLSKEEFEILRSQTGISSQWGGRRHPPWAFTEHTYVASGTPDVAATGMLSNTATVAAPSGVAELDTANNSATDDDQLEPTADLAISKQDGQTSAVPGTQVTYTISAANAGPSAIVEATVSDVFPSELEDVTWTCFASEGASCGAASGSGDISESVDLGVGTSVTFSATATIAAAATGFVSNTATVAVPAGSVDPEPGNDSATDVDALDPQADLTITKTDGQSTAIFGLPLTYTITATNNGPGDAPSASVIDLFPGLIDVTWTCTPAGGAACSAAGSGNLGDAVSLPVGASVTYTATGTVELDAASPLANTATVLPTEGLTDPDGANNSADDETDLVPGADLAVTKDDGRTAAVVGEELTYDIVVANNGPIDVFGAEVGDPFPPELRACRGSGIPAGSPHCASEGVAGGCVDPVDVPVGESVVFMALCVVA